MTDRETRINELHQKYLDAQENILLAPTILEQAKEEYYVYSFGKGAYNELKENEYQKEVEIKTEEKQQKFLNKINNLTKLSDNYKNNSTQIKELDSIINTYTQTNNKMKNIIKNQSGDILINERKSFYRTESTDKLNLWYYFWLYVYYILFIVLVLGIWLIRDNNYNKTMLKAFSIIILAGTYPIFIPYVIDGIIMLWYKFYNLCILLLNINTSL